MNELRWQATGSSFCPLVVSLVRGESQGCLAGSSAASSGEGWVSSEITSRGECVGVVEDGFDCASNVLAHELAACWFEMHIGGPLQRA